MSNGARRAWLFVVVVTVLCAASGACSGSNDSNVATPTPTVDDADGGSGYAAGPTSPGTAIVRSGYKTLVVNLTTGDVRERVTAPDVIAAYHSVGVFVESPDGTRLAYACGDGVAATPTPVDMSTGHITGDLCIWTARGALSPPAAVATDLQNPGLLSPDAWSPDGSKLVVRDQLLIGPAEPPVQSYLVDLETLRATRLLGGMEVSYAAWSPDSRRVAFTNATGLFVVDLRSGTSVNVAASPLAEAPTGYGVSELAWSPDGSSIAFTLTAAGHLVSSLYVASAVGASVRKIGTGGKDLRWSPDGQWIATAIDSRAIGSASASQCASGGPCSELHVIGIDGTEDRAVAKGMIDAEAPAWSPDGTRLAFRGSSGPYGSSGYQRVFVTDAAGDGQPRQISGDVWATAAPYITWSDDGKRIIFIGYPPEVAGRACGQGGCADGDLFMVDASGSGTPRQLYPDGVQRVVARVMSP